MLIRPSLFVTGILILAGCSLGQTEPRGSGPAPTTSPATAAVRSQPAPTTIPQQTAPKATLADLMGANSSHIDQLLGAPDIVRREGEGELRLYRSSTCVLHVFLYPRAGTTEATHIEARIDRTRLGSAQTNRCVASFF